MYKKTLEGTLVEAGEFNLMRPPWLGSWYEVECQDPNGKKTQERIDFPKFLNGITNSKSKPGDKITVYENEESTRVDVHGKWLGKLKHTYTFEKKQQEETEEK